MRDFRLAYGYNDKYLKVCLGLSYLNVPMSHFQVFINYS